MSPDAKSGSSKPVTERGRASSPGCETRGGRIPRRYLTDEQRSRPGAQPASATEQVLTAENAGFSGISRLRMKLICSRSGLRIGVSAGELGGLAVGIGDD